MTHPSEIDGPLSTETTALIQDDSSNAPKKRKTAWYWPWQPSYWAVIPISFLISLSFAPYAALIPLFLKNLFCERGIPLLTTSIQYGDDKDCDSGEYSAAIAKFIGIYSTVSALSVTLTIRYWSGLSDRIGRKQSMLINMTGMSISSIIFMIVLKYKEASLYLLYVGAAIEGLSGSSSLLDILSHTYATDLTVPEERTVIFGRISAGGFAGFALGAVVGGILAEKFGLDIVFFYMGPGITFFVFFYILLMPESMTQESLDINGSKPKNSAAIEVEYSSVPNALGSKDDDTTLTHFKSFIRGLAPDQVPNSIAGKHSISLLMVAITLIMTAVTVSLTLTPTYLAYQFHWTEVKLSTLTTLAGVFRLFSMAIVLPYIKNLAPKNSVSDPPVSINFDLKLVVVGILIESITFLFYCFSPVGEGFYVGAILSSFGSMFSPACRGILSQSVAPEQIGETLGTLVTLEVITGIVSPLAGGWLYSATLYYWPTAVFFISGILAFISAIVAFYVYRIHSSSLRGISSR